MIFVVRKKIMLAKSYIKIRIRYVLKSADVGTLFSSKYSENSSHAHTRRHPHTFTHTCAHPPTLRTPAHTHTHPCILAHTHTYSRTPAVVVELIVVVVVVVDEFELINHM